MGGDDEARIRDVPPFSPAVGDAGSSWFLDEAGAMGFDVPMTTLG